MEKKLVAFISLASLFKDNGYPVFLVGGAVRDYLLNKPLSDLDITGPASPLEIKQFIDDVDMTFAKFGSIKFKYCDEVFEYTTFRIEKDYLDYRHPQEIEFVDDITLDVKRRDFSINALYMDSKLKIYDYVDGIKDINNRLLNLIGDKEIRFVQDPLRIIRGLRFKVDYDLDIEPLTYQEMVKHSALINSLRREKIKQEINKAKNKIELIKLLKDMNIDLDM